MWMLTYCIVDPQAVLQLVNKDEVETLAGEVREKLQRVAKALAA